MVGMIALGWTLLQAQEPAAKPPDQDVKAKFQFENAPIEQVLQYASKVTGVPIINEAKATGTVTAVNDQEIPVAHVFAFLDSVLYPKWALVKMDTTWKVLKFEEAKQRTRDVRVTRDPAEIPRTDQVLTVICPLVNLNVVEVNKELSEIYPRNATTLLNTYSNSLIIIGRGDEIHRLVYLLSKIDVEAKDRLEIRVLFLKNADATETAKMINNMFIKDAQDEQANNPFASMFRMMARGGRGEGPGGVEAKEVASRVIRVEADTRTNAVVIAATKDNIELIAGVVRELDEVTGSVKMAIYVLRYADAGAVAQIINDLFETRQTPGAGQQQQGRGMNPWWMRGGGMGGGRQQPEPQATPSVLKAVADYHLNSVIVTGGENQLTLIKSLVDQLDQPMADLMGVRIFKLKNADATEMASEIRSLFDTAATMGMTAAGTGTSTRQGSTGRTGQTGTQAASQRAGTGYGGLLPSQQVLVASNTRTNSVIVKASAENMKLIEQMVMDLDAEPAQDAAFVTFRTRYNDPQAILQMLRTATSTGTGTSASQRQPWGNPFSQYRQGQQGQQGGMQGFNQGGRGSNTFGFPGGGFGGSGFGGSGFRQLGPLPEQDTQEPPPVGEPQEPEPPRGLRGTGLGMDVDPVTGQMIFRVPERDREQLLRLLEELDKPRPQVLIKCQVVDVSTDDARALGVEGSARAGDFTFSTDFAELNPRIVGEGAGGTLTVGRGDHQIRLQAMAREGRVKILATPSILALDNEISDITIGRAVPIITSSQTSDISTAVRNTFTYQQVGVILRINPHINPDGLVTLAVQPEVSDLDESRSVPVSEGLTVPTFTINRATTMINVRNGQTVVIGGLIRDSFEHVKQKVPLLGDIPLLGALFSRTDDVKTKRELMIFLTPYVVYSQRQLDELARVEKAKLKMIAERDLIPDGARWRKFMWR
jgi:general secretion pathway protein D